MKFLLVRIALFILTVPLALPLPSFAQSSSNRAEEYQGIFCRERGGVVRGNSCVYPNQSSRPYNGARLAFKTCGRPVEVHLLFKPVGGDYQRHGEWYLPAYQQSNFRLDEQFIYVQKGYIVYVSGVERKEDGKWYGMTWDAGTVWHGDFELYDVGAPSYGSVFEINFC